MILTVFLIITIIVIIIIIIIEALNNQRYCSRKMLDVFCDNIIVSLIRFRYTIP